MLKIAVYDSFFHTKQFSSLFVQFYVFNGKISVNSELISDIATLCVITIVLRDSYKNETKHKNSSELPNVAQFDVLNCFRPEKTHFTLDSGKKTSGVILSYVLRDTQFGTK